MKEAEYLIRARYSILYIRTQEEERALRAFKELSLSLNKRLVVWTAAKGLMTEEDNIDNKTMDFKAALVKAEELAKEPTLFLWLDLHPFLTGHNSAGYIRKFREFSQRIRSGFPSNSIVISPKLEIPIELEKEIAVLDLPLPEIDEVKEIIYDFTGLYQGQVGVDIDQSPEVLEALSRAAVGLTQSEIENCLAKTLVKNRRISIEDVSGILDEKKQIIQKSGILEYVSTENLDLKDIGGLENLKRWLIKRKASYTVEARKFGLKWPKGVLLVGVPGCGKSLCAKSVAAAWKMPLLKLDMGRVFSGVLGSSEENMRSALAMCEAVSPSIVWIDEIEKAISGNGKTVTDGGTSQRIFGTLLTWMQEKKSPVFVFATANRIDQLPTELLRKGRFDEMFFVDLPTAEERAEIFRIHIEGLNRKVEDFNIHQLVQASGEEELGEGVRLTGSEIAASVHEGLMEAFLQKTEADPTRDLMTDDIIKAINRTVPLARSRSREIGELRTWANEYAVRASVINTSIASVLGITKEFSVGRSIDF